MEKNNNNWINIKSYYYMGSNDGISNYYLDTQTKTFFFLTDDKPQKANLDNYDDFVSYIESIFLALRLGPDSFTNTEDEIQKIYEIAYDTPIPNKYVFVEFHRCGCSMGNCNYPISYNINEYVCTCIDCNYKTKITNFGHIYNLWGTPTFTKKLKNATYYDMDFNTYIHFSRINTSEKKYIYENGSCDGIKKEVILPFDDNKIYIEWSYTT